MCKEATNCELRDRVNELGNEMADAKSRLSKVAGKRDALKAGIAAAEEIAAFLEQAIDN